MNEGAPSYVANPDVSCREELDGAVLFNPDTDVVMVINATGVLLWHTLAEPRTASDLVAHLLETCEGVPADRVQADVEAFLQSLRPGGFVEQVSGEGAV